MTRPTDSLPSERHRRELWVVGAFCALWLVVPPFVVELYPFSSMTMFAVPVKQCCVYEVRTPSGRRLSNRRFGLQMNNPHDPPVRSLGRHGYGRKSPFSINRYEELPSREVVVEQVRRSLRKFPKLKFVYVTQKVIGATDSAHVGLMAVHTWKVRRLHGASG